MEGYASKDGARAAAWFTAFIAVVFTAGAVAEFYPPLCAIPIAVDATAGKTATWCFEFWLARYQTLISGLLAIAAAAVSVFFLYRQTRQADEHEHERYRRRHAAARAVLPLSLSAICDYAEASTDQLRLALTFYGSQQVSQMPVNVDPAPPPTEAISQMREFVETLASNDSRPVALIISKIQMHIGRTKSDLRAIADPEHSTQIVPRLSLNGYIVDAAEIYARGAMLFKYARQETDELPSDPQRKDVYSALFNMNVWTEDYPEVADALERRFQTEDGPSRPARR